MDANACDHVAAPGEESRRDRVLTEDEIKTFWKDLSNEQLPIASTFKLRLLTAQRGGEVLSVEWKELDLDGAWWTLRNLQKQGLIKCLGRGPGRMA